jgi:hypothetical protein
MLPRDHTLSRFFNVWILNVSLTLYFQYFMQNIKRFLLLATSYNRCKCFTIIQLFQILVFFVHYSSHKMSHFTSMLYHNLQSIRHIQFYCFECLFFMYFKQFGNRNIYEKMQTVCKFSCLIIINHTVFLRKKTTF